jgi:putative oxidoreductase
LAIRGYLVPASNGSDGLCHRHGNVSPNIDYRVMDGNHTPNATINSRYPLPDLGLLVLRVFAGLALALAHGINKIPPSERFIGGVTDMGFPLPIIFAWAAGLSEFAGGILLALGLLTRPAAGFILVTMLVAAFIRQAGDPFGERELALLFGAVAALFIFAGSGRFGLDALLLRRTESDRRR